MKKLSDYKENEREKIETLISNKSASLLGVDRWDTHKSNFSTLKKFGLCSTCRHFQYAKTEFNVLIAKCYDLEIKLNNQNPVDNCTSYNRKGELTLNAMMEMAIIIEPPKNKLGFK